MNSIVRSEDVEGGLVLNGDITVVTAGADDGTVLRYHAETKAVDVGDEVVFVKGEVRYTVSSSVSQEGRVRYDGEKFMKGDGRSAIEIQRNLDGGGVDQMRIHMMKEHVTTIEKSMKKIVAAENQNQTVRWVMNKEKHADELSEITTYYFMAQRIKPGSEGYAVKLGQLHEILVYSMKAKQSTDLAHVEKLKTLIHDFEKSYLGEKH